MLEHGADPPAERLGLVGGVGLLGHDPVDDAEGVEVEGAHLLGARPSPGRGRCRGARSRGRPPAAAARATRAGRRRPGRRAAAPAPRRRCPRRASGTASGASSEHQVRQAPGDLAGQPAVLGLGRQRGALGVDHGHQRQPQLRRPAASRAAPRAAPRGRAGVGASDRAGPGRATRTARRRSAPAPACRPGSDSPWPVPLSGITSVAAYLSSRRTPGRSGRRDRVTDVPRVDVARPRRRRRHGGATVARSQQDRERPVERSRRAPRARRRRR